MTEELEPIDVSKYEITETGQVLKVSKKEMSDMKDRAREYLRRQAQLNGGDLFHCNILNLVLGFAEQENEKLKVDNAFYEKACEGTAMMYKDLQKAKEIIKKYMRFKPVVGGVQYYYEEYSKTEKEAEQFLKDSEVKQNEMLNENE